MSNLNLDGYPHYIHENIIDRLKNRKHPLGDLSIYDRKYDINGGNYEEIIASDRYKELVDSYVSAFEKTNNYFSLNEYIINLSQFNIEVLKSELGYKSFLCELAERLIRDEYNLDESEVLFDLEIVDGFTINAPSGMDCSTTCDEAMEVIDNEDNTDKCDEYEKRRIINALQQGAAMKGLYLYYLTKDELDNKIPNITNIYKKAMSANDLMYYIIDINNSNCFSDGDDEGQVSSYVKIDFINGKPVIEAKSINFPGLLHEVIKGVIELLALQGLPEDEDTLKDVINNSDYVDAEFWDIRLGSVLWEKFHNLIDIDDYDIKKLILIDLFKKPAKEFNNFMYNVLNNEDLAKKEVNYISKDIRIKINEYHM